MTAAMARNSSRLNTEPVGLHGDEYMMSLVRSVMAASSCAAVTL